MVRKIVALCIAAALTGCGDSGSSPVTSTTAVAATPTAAPAPAPTPAPAPAPALTNFATITVDAGPSSIPAVDGAINRPFVSATICAPGSTTNCQTIDHLILDTGAVGLRVIKSAINPGLLSALPAETQANGNAVGECYQYITSYVFGSVRQGDFSIGGEHVANMPFHVIGDGGTFASVPSTCSSGGGDQIATVTDFGANGTIGIGPTTTDCGATCAAGNSSGAIYYDCPTSGCSAVIARSASETAPFQQIPNPVAAFPVDNNGTLLVMQSVTPQGSATATGTVYFGIGTQTNNGLGTATVLTANKYAEITANYNGKAFTQSFIDSGSPFYSLIDSAIPLCKTPNFTGFYCPVLPTLLSPVIVGTNGATKSAAFTLYNAEQSSIATTNAGTINVLDGLGDNLNVIYPKKGPFNNTFDFGFPLFFGRGVYTGIAGRTAQGNVGPFFAY